MDKRLQKRHKRQVERAKAHVKLSEPDVRTPEQIAAAREASRVSTAVRTGASSSYSNQSNRNHSVAAGHSAAKTDA